MYAIRIDTYRVEVPENKPMNEVISWGFPIRFNLGVNLYATPEDALEAINTIYIPNAKKDICSTAKDIIEHSSFQGREINWTVQDNSTKVHFKKIIHYTYLNPPEKFNAVVKLIGM
jgi:hypothetical protein